MTHDITHLTKAQIDELLFRLQEQRPPAPAPLSTSFRMERDNNNWPFDRKVLHDGVAPITIELYFDGSNGPNGKVPMNFVHRDEEGTERITMLFPPPTSMTKTSKFIAIELGYKGFIEGRYVIRCQ